MQLYLSHSQIGTSITVRGGLQPYTNTGNNPPVFQGSVDNGPPSTYTSSLSPLEYIVVVYYQSPALPMGEHVLTVQNMADNDIIHVDSFIIRAASGKPQILQSDGSPTPVQAPTTPTVSSSSPIPSTTAPSAGISHNSDSTSSRISMPFQSSKDPLIPTQQRSSTPSSIVSTSVGDLTATHSSTLSFLTPGVYPDQPTAASSERLPAHVNHNAIIASCVCGSILAITVIALLLTIRYKRRKGERTLLQPYTTSQMTTNRSPPPFTMPHSSSETPIPSISSPSISATTDLNRGTRIGPRKYDSTERRQNQDLATLPPYEP